MDVKKGTTQNAEKSRKKVKNTKKNGPKKK